ncbi:Prolyl endopeptidase [Balamuthia mandrillaris]
MYVVIVGMEPVEEPRAEKRPFRLVTHGDVRIDDYYYLREREDAAVQDYIQQEMKYCSTMMKDTESLQAELYDELLARVQETDRSYPYLIRSTNSAETEQQENYFYYHRTEQGKKYKIHCRKRLTTVTDEWSEEEAAKVEEEVILDENEYAERLELNFLSVGDMEVSPNQRYLAYSVDTEGGERFELRVKDLSTGQDVDEPIHDVYYSVQWSNDSNYLFYVTVDDAMRPFKVWRHRIGTSVADDVLIYHEEDDAFFVSVTKTSSEKYLLIYSNSQITSEAHFSDAFDPEDPFTVVQPRIHKMEYSVEEHDGEFWIVTNHEAKNFRVMKTKVDNPSMDYWEEVIPHNPAVKVNSLAIFKNFAVVKERENGLNQLRIIDLTNSNHPSHLVDVPEPVYHIYTSDNYVYDTDKLRFTYTSLSTPKSVFMYDMNDRSRILLKQEPVRGGYDKQQYETKRIFVKSSSKLQNGGEGEEVLVPMSLVYRKDIFNQHREANLPQPTLLYGYGSYGISIDTVFDSKKLSLLDRGFIYAIAHIRGGGEMGRHWYESGKLLEKKNTFYDFINCAQYLIDNNYTASNKLAIEGRSAGGLLMGAVTNMATPLFRAVIAGVPFSVDVLTTMLDETIPLTVIEYEEWGNPNHKEYYDYMKTYSPIDNLEAKEYPNMLITTGLSDPRVQYWEPLKWAAKLRDVRKQNGNLLLLQINKGTGHMGEADRYKYLKEVAFNYAFILKSVKPALLHSSKERTKE